VSPLIVIAYIISAKLVNLFKLHKNTLLLKEANKPSNNQSFLSRFVLKHRNVFKV